ncbi:MAG: hypothetical protein JWQ40_2428 [Segetibacter sp.]|nr:hypothetical protein [Segetibacter sp.]
MVQQYNECEQKQSAVLGVAILYVKNIQAQTAIKPAAKLKDVVALCVLLLNDE